MHRYCCSVRAFLPFFSILWPWDEFRPSALVDPLFDAGFLRNFLSPAERLLLCFVQVSQPFFNLEEFQKSNGSGGLLLGQPGVFLYINYYNGA